LQEIAVAWEWPPEIKVASRKCPLRIVKSK
jgi:hypothetical protein